MERLRVSIQTLGCRVNQYDSEMMQSRLEPDYVVATEDPDVVILNACTVTALAERKARQAARRVRRHYPDVCIVVMGCLADAVDQGTTHFSDADLLAGNSWKARINEVVEMAASGVRGILAATELTRLSDERTPGPDSRIRAFVKIQDGCGRACTYCRATQVRGEPRSKPMKDVLAEVSQILSAGYPEIVLTGIDLAQYSPADGSLAEAVRAIASLNGLRRLRMASINPSGLTPELIDVCASHETVCSHFHIPLQSGDSRILAAMRRGYSAHDYLETIERVRSRIPHASFGTDIIVGFPGEDDRAFAQTCTVVETVNYSNLHIFRYSQRKGTEAATFANQVPPEVKRRRSEALSSRWSDRLAQMLDKRIGSTQHVLVEEQRQDGWRGYTDDYVYVRFSSSKHIPVGSIFPVRITGRMGAALEGVDDHRIDICRDARTG